MPSDITSMTTMLNTNAAIRLHNSDGAARKSVENQIFKGIGVNAHFPLRHTHIDKIWCDSWFLIPIGLLDS